MEPNTEIKPEDKPKVDFDTKKWLYSFTAKNPKGDDAKFYLLKPMRSLRQLGEIEYAKQLSVFVRSGLLPKAAWNTILENLGGTISDSEARNYSDAKRRFFEASLEKSKLEVKPDLSDEEKEKMFDYNYVIEQAQKDIQSFELEQIYVFENTAEAKARNSTVQWWLTQLSYKNEKQQFFVGNSVDEKLDWYDMLDYSGNNVDELFQVKVGQRFNYLITLWFLGRISTPEEFAAADAASLKSDEDDETPKATIPLAIANAPEASDSAPVTTE